jgi:polyribonucleotide nucleotidyltransferase
VLGLGYCEELSKLLDKASDRFYDLSFDVSVATSEEDVNKVLKELLDLFEKLVFYAGVCAHEVIEKRVELRELERRYRKMLKERARKAKVEAEAKIKEKVAIPEFEPKLELLGLPAIGEFLEKAEEEAREKEEEEEE